MKSIFALAAIATAAFTFSGTADAGPRHKHVRTYVYVEVIEEPRYIVKKVYRKKHHIETPEDILANSRDPAGNYKGYPSWARAALAGGGRRW